MPKKVTYLARNKKEVVYFRDDNAAQKFVDWLAQDGKEVKEIADCPWSEIE